MAVDIRRGADVAVAQPFLDLLHRHVVGQQQRGAAMPEIVKADMPQAGLLEEPAENGGQGLGVEKISHGVHKDVR